MFKGFRPTLGYGFVFLGWLVFPNVLFSLVFWFSRMIVWFCKNLRENKKNKKRKEKENISKGGSETFKNFVVCLFSLMFVGFLWLSFVFVISQMFVWLCKNIRENQKNKKRKTKKHIQGWV